MQSTFLILTICAGLAVSAAATPVASAKSAASKDNNSPGASYWCPKMNNPPNCTEERITDCYNELLYLGLKEADREGKDTQVEFDLKHDIWVHPERMESCIVGNKLTSGLPADADAPK
ncbi:hypothetical protein HRG_004514 [Hirsutella rhossiliensis]|uniref:Uncharacterized protein n=1 Tax=Hirsutella rhossiliensis TaxID=111463 RepID=A0A9P8SKF5_9HYPO|nr:uncharacterized protein HRG_04514 [Hirsutella rhossiliensis]KAH0964086.1 hypothetical protein HRG_04514 [Hirsutella rhossiliensis]